MYRDNTNDDDKHPISSATSEILMFGSSYNHLLGILAGGFYLHNISLPIYRNSKYPENSVRDVFLGFLAVCLSYIFCGILGAFGFSSHKIFGDDKIIQDNCLNNFGSKDGIAIIMRLCVFF